MKRIFLFGPLFLILSLLGCKSIRESNGKKMSKKEFPARMVDFMPYKNNPIFTGTHADTWDKDLQERGYILFEDGLYKLWYTGYNDEKSDTKYLGYATSEDGIHWEKYPGNPIFKDKWTEDVFVTKNNGTYYMYAEGRNDIAHLLTSQDGIHWKEEGDLVIKKVNGEIIPGPYGTPTVWVENGKWYLYYERNDQAIWMAASSDHIHWTNIQDAPVISKGPDHYDAGVLAADQVIKYKGRYFLYYHASSMPMETADVWTSNVAMSTDLVHWIKYEKNPIAGGKGDISSPVVVYNGKEYWLYALVNKEEWLYLPK